MFDHVREIARQHGRTLLETEIGIAVGTEDQALGPAFLQKRGLTQRHTEYRNQLRLLMAVAPDGSLAGHTVLNVPPGEDKRAFQGGTLVLSAHRGHRLDDENAPMVAVNRDLGFRAIEVCQQWQGMPEPR